MPDIGPTVSQWFSLCPDVESIKFPNVRMGTVESYNGQYNRDILDVEPQMMSMYKWKITFVFISLFLFLYKPQDKWEW